MQHLERQIDTLLFARLLKSRDKAGVMDLATRGQVLEHPVDAIKHTFGLDFLDLSESEKLRESDLESAILEKLQHFLLELGKGFAFVARQKRLCKSYCKCVTRYTRLLARAEQRSPPRLGLASTKYGELSADVTNRVGCAVGVTAR